MRLICPGCGAIASLEIWSNDPAAREVVDIISKLPGCVANRAPAYLALFRRGNRGLNWARALRILTELQQLVSARTVHWEGEEERPAPPELWAMVMDKMLTRGWERPLEDHNWLRKVVWSEARPLAAEKEQEHHAEPRRRREGEEGRHPREACPRNGQSGGGDPGANEGERQKRRGCFTCAGFKPPKGCGVDSRPVSGNQVMGCDKWRAKVTSAGNVMGNLAAGLQEMMDGKKDDTENPEGGL